MNAEYNEHKSIAKNLGLQDSGKVKEFIFRYLDGKLITSPDKLKKKLNNIYKQEKETKNEEEAAVYLGITEDSLKKLIDFCSDKPEFKFIKGKRKFLRIFLDDFIDKIIKKSAGNKKPPLFTSIPRHREAFIKAVKEVCNIQLEKQICESDGCGEIAYQICSNITCRENKNPRRICLAHGELAEKTDKRKSVRYRPDVLCMECSQKVIDNKLGGYKLLGRMDK